MKNRIIPIEKLESLMWKPGEDVPQPPRTISGGSSVPGTVSLQKVDDGFVFHNLPNVGSVKLLNDYLDSGSSKKHDDWRVYCASRNDGIVVPNSIFYFQMARILYSLRNDDSCKELVKECFELFKLDWTSKYPHSGTKVKYKNGLEGVVNHLQIDGTVKETSIEIPEFTKLNDDWSYLVLAPEQAETNLGTVNAIQDNAKPVLQELLGEGYEQAGEVFQYVSPRKNSNLREIRLWTPTAAKRNTERAVVLGFDDGYFSIDAVGGIGNDGPARGVVAVRQKSP